MIVSAGSIARAFGPEVIVGTTLSIGKLRLPFRLIGQRNALRLHDRRTARWLQSHHSGIDLVHGWPLSSLETFRVAKRHGISCLLERPNAHTAYAYESSAEESRRVGIELPPNHDHQLNAENLAHEEREYAEADYLLCPSDFVKQTFLDRGFPAGRLLRHHYGFDSNNFFPVEDASTGKSGLTMLYAGVCEPRKGLHYALEAWLASGAHETGVFLICGTFVPGYAEKLAPMLAHPSVKVLGHRTDLPELMQQSDLFVLPSVEEGSALVTYEARGSGCVLLVSDAAGAVCTSGHDGLVHSNRDAGTLSGHISLLNGDRDLLARMRENTLASRSDLTWTMAGKRVVDHYLDTTNARDRHPCRDPLLYIT